MSFILYIQSRQDENINNVILKNEDVATVAARGNRDRCRLILYPDAIVCCNLKTKLLARYFSLEIETRKKDSFFSLVQNMLFFGLFQSSIYTGQFLKVPPMIILIPVVSYSSSVCFLTIFFCFKDKSKTNLKTAYKEFEKSKNNVNLRSKIS
jgi:hypothetical protein